MWFRSVVLFTDADLLELELRRIIPGSLLSKNHKLRLNDNNSKSKWPIELWKYMVRLNGSLCNTNTQSKKDKCFFLFIYENVK